MNNNINTIVISGTNTKKSDLILEVKDYETLKNMLKEINKENIKTLKITCEEISKIDYELLKEFQNLEHFDLNPQRDIYKKEPIELILDLSILYNLYNTFPNLKMISFDKSDDKILEVYDKLDLTLNIRKEKKLDTKNQYLKFKNKYEALKLSSIHIFDSYKMDDILELPKYCKEIDTLYFLTEKIEETKKIYDYLTEKGIKIKRVSYNLNNKHYSSKNLEMIKEISEVSSVTINYGNPNHISIEDFINMREALDYWVSVIKENDLSPVEKIMYAYDIVKTFEYKENENNKLSARELVSIIKTGDIVCVGYSELLNQILKELGIKASKCNIYADQLNYGEKKIKMYNPTSQETNHACSLIKIDDDKYNIHGIYFFDTTSDSGGEYLDNYNFFAISMLDYKERYIDKTDSSYPHLFSYALAKYENDNLLNDDELQKHLNLFFGKQINQDEFNRYLDADALTFRQLEEILINVRLAQGYNEEMLDEEIQKLAKNIDNKPKFNIQ